MKTAISLPDELFTEADAVAARLGMSRSQLYAAALAEWLAKHRDADITAALDRVYADADGRDTSLNAAASDALRRAEWS